MPVKPAEVNVDAVSKAKDSRRTVTPEDAGIMMRSPNEWFEAEHGCATYDATGLTGRRLMVSLPKWYGGSWSVRTVGTKIYVRYDGELKMAS